ncbi:MAG: hypothetical protein ACJ74Z_07215 [Bryobacteraceae bacterium]
MPNRLPAIEFGDCDDVRDRLSKAQKAWQTFVVQKRSQGPKNWDAIVKHSVGPNAFRGFRHQTPSKSFWQWATKHFRKEHFEALIGQPNEMSFDKAHSELVDSLIEGWPSAINYGQAAKLTDLAVLSGYESSQLSPELLDKASSLIHVPLDEYVLVAIRICAKTFPGPDAIRNISTRPSMGFVKSQRQYKAFQSGIRSVATKAGVPPLVLNYITWTKSH